MPEKLVFVLANLVLLAGFLPAFAEVTDLQLDKSSYMQGESMSVKGVVSGDSSGLVSIVLRDPNNKFVLLSQAFIQDDNSFEKIIPINEKFQLIGNHNATAFVLNMTAGKTQSFNLVDILPEKELGSKDKFSEQFQLPDFILKDTLTQGKEKIENNPEPTSFQIQEESSVKRSQEKINNNESQIADFVDISKDPQHYLDRYYNEPDYKIWFDRNYPNLTIEEAVGYEGVKKTGISSINENVGTSIIPQAEAISSMASPINSESKRENEKVVLFLGGLGILFGAVYGVKRKAESNTRLFSFNKSSIYRKITLPRIKSKPMSIIQTRLAKGEISIEEYGKLKQEFEKSGGR